MSITSFWLYQCQSKQAYTLLEQYGYYHDELKYGDIGGLKVRLSGKRFEPCENGPFMIALAVWQDTPSWDNNIEDPILNDIIAWRPEAPSQWYFYRGEQGLVLNERSMFECTLLDNPLIIHSTPLAWLQSGCRGCVLLDEHALKHLQGVNDVICEDVHHGTQIENSMHAYLMQGMPNLSVPNTEYRV